MDATRIASSEDDAGRSREYGEPIRIGTGEQRVGASVAQAANVVPATHRRVGHALASLRADERGEEASDGERRGVLALVTLAPSDGLHHYLEEGSEHATPRRFGRSRSPPRG